MTDTASFNVTGGSRPPRSGVVPDRNGFSTRSSEVGTVLQIEEAEGRLRLHRNESNTTAALTTDRYRVEETDAPGKHRIDVEKGNGRFRLTTAGGRQMQASDGVAQAEAFTLYHRFLREKEKLLERYRLARNITRRNTVR